MSQKEAFPINQHKNFLQISAFPLRQSYERDCEPHFGIDLLYLHLRKFAQIKMQNFFASSATFK